MGLETISTQITMFGNLVLAALRPRLALVGRIDTNTYPGVVAADGSVISIPALTVSGSMIDRAVGGGANVGSSSSKNVNITMNQGTFTVPFDNLVQTFSNVQLVEEFAARMAIIAANYVDSKLTTMYKYIPYAVGATAANAGNALFNTADNYNALNLARLQLMRNLAPMDRLRCLVNPTEASNIRALPIYNNANQAGSAANRQDGSFADQYGISIWESQNAKTNVQLAKAAVWGAAPLVNSATAAIGDTTLPVDALGVGTIPAGSIFTLGTDSNGYPIPYTVTADTAIVANAATLPISPALKTAPADNDPLTARSMENPVSIGLVYDPSVVQLVIRPQAPFIGPSVLTQQFNDPDSGLSFRLHLESNVAINEAAGQAYQNKLTMDILVGAAVLRPEFAVRLEGQI